MRNLSRQPGRRAFTLIELLAVIATIATLAALLLPILAKTKVKAIQAQCMSNLHQLGLAWMMYSSENNGYLVQSYPVNNPNAWILGDMSVPSQAIDASLIRKGKLFPYNQNVSIYHCPADRGRMVGSRRLPTTRSYSMNSFMGFRDIAAAPVPITAAGFVPFFARESDIPQPSQRWVLVDEDERSINDGFFVTDPTARVWVDFPANSARRHKFSYCLNFADGHSEVWKYRDSRTRLLAKNKEEQAGNGDLKRLAEASTSKR